MKNQPPGYRYALVVIGLALLTMLVMDFNSRMAELRRLTAEREAVRENQDRFLGTKAALETQIAYATSEAAVIEWAYQDGHMVRPGDVAVVPLPAGQPTPTPMVTQVEVEEEVSYWQRWFALFFAPRAP